MKTRRQCPKPYPPNYFIKPSSFFKARLLTAPLFASGGLYGPGRDPGGFFAGKTGIANGLAPVNLVHLDAAVSITEKLIANKSGNLIVNAVSTDHPTRMEFYRSAAKRIRLPAQEFIAELNQWKIVNSIHSDYKFGIPGPS